MSETLKNLKPAQGAIRKKVRKGRGIASGYGKTSGRGHRGQKCRSGYSKSPFREGGQTPLYRRLPKRQVNTRVNRKEFSIVNLTNLQALADKGIKEVNLEILVAHGFVKSAEDWGLKVLGAGEIKSAIKIHANRISATALEAIEKAGGSVELV